VFAGLASGGGIDTIDLSRIDTLSDPAKPLRFDLAIADQNATALNIPNLSVHLRTRGIDSLHPESRYFEHVVGSQQQPNELVGNAADNSLTGGTQPDRMFGGEGDDVVLGQAGDDVLDGGPGEDSLVGAAGNDVLLGNADKDHLVGDDPGDQNVSGRDMLFGGLGPDTLVGGPDDDILVGGRVEYEDISMIANLNALERILDEWQSIDYDSRIANIRNGLGGPDNPRLLTMAPSGGTLTDTVFDDLIAVDVILGGDGRDWFFADRNELSDWVIICSTQVIRADLIGADDERFGVALLGWIDRSHTFVLPKLLTSFATLESRSHKALPRTDTQFD
jgi:Ca2+-binding RTX toxin-like protein